jgi:hypothetical protein
MLSVIAAKLLQELPGSFYKFGPWSQAVNERIDPALAAIGANKKTFPSNFDDKNDWFRWQVVVLT